MKAFFVGGPTDNSEVDLEVSGKAPAHYPPNGGSGIRRYELLRCVERNDRLLYAIYAPPEMSAVEVERIVGERGYERRFHGHAPG